jgi:uncharacterized membrane protein
MHLITPELGISTAIFMMSQTDPTVLWMSVAGVISFLIGIMAVRGEIARARGLDKIVALANLCFAMPLAAFGAEHFTLASAITQLVPKFIPWHLFWTYFVGVGLLAASLSIATKIQARWAGLFFGLMMFLFVATMDLPGTLKNIHNRIIWALLCREMSFGAGGWMIAAAAMDQRGQARKTLLTIGGLIIGIAAMFYGVEHFLHPANVPGVPLEKFMPVWIPVRAAISYLTGAILLIAGALMLIGNKKRVAATYLGSWILLVVVFVYGPILIASLRDPNVGTKIEGLNYFFDTLLYAGTTLALAKASAYADGG